MELEYLLIHRGRRGNSFLYELVYKGEGKDGSKFTFQLINEDKEKNNKNEQVKLDHFTFDSKNGRQK